MTPKQQSPGGANEPRGQQAKSGNPATQQSIKQQRAEKREEKVARFKREQARKRRNKRLGIGAAIVGGVGVVGLLVTSAVLNMPQYASYQAGFQDIDIEGLEEFTLGNAHTTEPVDYQQNPPAGGDHNPAWLNCGVYDQPQANENAVHSLEHGAVWVTYDPALPEEDVEALRDLMPSTYAILSPFEGLDTPVAVSAWNAQVKVDGVDDERIEQFFEAYWQSENVPEPGALCTGAIDGPGQVS